MNMKRKNGFTLIELLAIIVILAIIAVITVPIILNIIETSKKGAVQDSAYGYKDALQKYYATKSVQNPEQELPNGYVEISELPSDFIVSGENPSDGWVNLKKGIVEKYSLKYKDYVVTMDNDKNITLQKQDKVDPHVPNEYQEVEYLESTGTQYIDTAYVPQQNDYLELRNVTRKSGGALFSAGTGDYQLIYLNAGSNNYFKFFATGAAANFQLSSHIDSKNIKVYNNNLYIDDQLYTTSNPVGDVNTDLRLFARKNDTNYINAQIGNVIIKNNNILVRNLVPVIRKSDNKPGMLDTANLSKNLFDENYENISANLVYKPIYVGDGTFTLSTDIPNSSNKHLFLIGGNVNSGASSGTNGVSVTIPRTVESIDGYVTIVYRNSDYTNDPRDCHTMLNEGSEALPYESYKKSFYTNDGTGEFIAGPEI